MYQDIKQDRQRKNTKTTADKEMRETEKEIVREKHIVVREREIRWKN